MNAYQMEPKASHTHSSRWQCGIIASLGKRLPMLFVMLNLFALIQYKGLMEESLSRTKLQHHESLADYKYHIGNRSSQNKQTNSGAIGQQIKVTNDRIWFSNKPLTNTTLTTKQNETAYTTNTRLPAIVTAVAMDSKIDYGTHTNQDNSTEHEIDSVVLRSHSLKKTKNKGRFAYAFLLGGVKSEKHGTDYRGGMYSAIVAAHNLRLHGSKADVIVMIQMSATTNATSLSKYEESIFEGMGIRLVYLPKFSHYKMETFYSLMMEKFRVLQFEEYSRVLYMDADVLPKCNLDYIFELSEEGNILRENVALAYKGEPASGGFFVLKPNQTDYEELTKIIRRVESSYLQLPYPHWDDMKGWGHIIHPSDPWKATKGYSGTNWTFYGSQADQGLLYFWTKYYKRSVSIINMETIEHWGTEPGASDLKLLRTDFRTLDDHKCSNKQSDRSGWKFPPYSNFAHLTGRGKPWYSNRTELEERLRKKENGTTFEEYTDTEYWYWLLKDAIRHCGLEANFSYEFISDERKNPAVGKTPSFDQRAQYMRRKAKNGWRQYEYEEARKDNVITLSVDPSEDTRKWAYAFLLGGARSDKKGTEYLGGLYSVIVSTYQLRKLGSRADFVLMVQIAAESPYERLPASDEDMLKKMNIKVIYIPKFADASLECFYSLMMEKFRILTLTEYSRVMYLDYDVLPTCNLDYLFDLSDPTPKSSLDFFLDDSGFQLKENVVIAYQSEPSSGGIFVLKPNASDYEHIQRIIHEKEVRSLEMPYPHWDPIVGWGHVFRDPDYWKDVRGRVRSNWTWYGVQADQGLLYYWTKYVKKSVSIIARDDIEQWDVDDWNVTANGTLVLRKKKNSNDEVPKIAKKALSNYGCPITGFLLAPYNDFFHMTGRAKPWYRTKEQLENPDCTKHNPKECLIQVEWYHLLQDALTSIKALDDFSWDFLGSKADAPLGFGPTDEQVAMYMHEKKRRNWKQYKEAEPPE